MPTPLTKEDVTSLLRQLPSLAEPTSRIAIAPDQDHSLTGLGGVSPQEVIILQGSVVVTSGQFQKCLLRMGPLLDRKAKALFSWRLSFGSNDLIENQEDAGEPTGGYATFKSHFETPSKAGGSRKGTKSKNSAESKDSLIKKQLQDFLTIQDVKDEVKAMEPEFDSTLVNAVASALHQELLQNLRERNRSMVLTQAAQDDDQVHAEETPALENIDLEVPDVHPLSDSIRLYANAVDLFEGKLVEPARDLMVARLYTEFDCYDTRFFGQKLSQQVSVADAVCRIGRSSSAERLNQASRANAECIQGSHRGS